MADRFINIQWLVQRNLTSVSDFERLKESCSKIGVGFFGIDIIPFTEELPGFDKRKNSIVYGSTTFNNLAFQDTELRKGIFFNEINFSIENYLDKWGGYMLNYQASVITFRELIENKEFSSDKLLFIRPNDDSKSFSGEVKRFDEIGEWYNKLKAVENTNLSLDSKIVLAEPYNIHFEWRLWIVNKRVIASSKYREYFKLKKEEGCPPAVISFAEERCLEYTPHDVFVMDICLCGDEYYIVECGCMNGAGFYNANIDNIVSNITSYFRTTI